jgi:hypothetical protein
VKWPAIAIQSVFLAANIAFLLYGSTDEFILASTTIILFLFTLQAVSQNPRFLYLFPVRTPENISTPSWDTWILRGLIVISIFLFYIGATGSHWFSFLFAFLVLTIGIGFGLIWDKYIESRNKNRIERLVHPTRNKNMRHDSE